MAWNEPGGGQRDPWGGRGGGGDQGPPDLDEVVRKLQERLGGLFGGKGSSGGNSGSGGSGSGPTSPMGRFTGPLLGVIAALIGVIWLASGIYIIDPAYRGVVTRFGAYVDTTGPGPHWHIPFPIEKVRKVNVDEISTFSHKAAMLTQDENIVDVELTVQSRIQDAANFLFQDQNPDKTLRDATVTVTRVTIGGSRLDFVMTEGRGAVAVIIKERVQELMDQYQTGLLVTSVNMQPARPPEQVKDAFDDAIKAREDKERIENQAEAYANEVLPRAGGEAARIIADARAYRDRVIAEAEGETARFLSVLQEYAKAPDVTRERLFIETMEQVLAENPKVLIDVQDAGNTLMYLPLDQLIKPRDAMPPRQTSLDLPTPSVASGTPDRQTRNVDRERRMR